MFYRNILLKQLRFYSQNYKLPVNTVVNFVPQQEAWIVERFGKFYKVLEAGLNILLPFVDKIKYVQNLKEVALEVPSQSAITKDNVTLHLDGVLFFRVIDPYQASYGIDDHEFAITQLAQTTMRSEIGRIMLDDVFKERDTLNKQIVEAISGSVEVWGIKCLRYEIRDVTPPSRVLEAMQMQVEAERKKRAAILESEGLREAAINQATGEAQSILTKAQARSQAINLISQSLAYKNGYNAATLSLAEQYVNAFSNLAKQSNTVIIPANTNDAVSMVSQAMSIFKTLSNSLDKNAVGEKGLSSSIESKESEIKDFTIENSPTFHKNS